MKQLHVFGAGGHAREILQLLRDLRDDDLPGVHRQPSCILVDRGYAGPEALNGLPLLIGEAAWPSPAEAAIVVAIGASSARAAIVRRLVAHGYAYFPTLVHPRAWVAPSARLGEGCIVFAGALINADVTLHAHVHVNLGCSVSHDSVLHDFVTLAPGVRVCGNGIAQEMTDVGAGAVLIPHARVGAGSIVGAGSVVTGEIPAGVTAVGVPARVLQKPGLRPAVR